MSHTVQRKILITADEKINVALLTSSDDYDVLTASNGREGLEIVKRIMDLHNEQVGIIDNPDGQGSVFWLTLKKA